MKKKTIEIGGKREREKEKQKMDASWARALRIVPPRSVSEAKTLSRRAPFVLYCYKSSCPACAAFASERRAFESRRFGVRAIVDWNCDEESRRRLATDAGARRIPAYVVFADGATVVEPE